MDDRKYIHTLFQEMIGLTPQECRQRLDALRQHAPKAVIDEIDSLLRVARRMVHV